MRKLARFGVAAAALLAGCASPAAAPPDPLVSSRLERFESEADFLAYVRSVSAAARAQGQYWATTGKNVSHFALYDTAPLPPPPPASPPPAPALEAPTSPADSVVVTGSANTSEVSRESISVVDSITAQDLGAFPDSNLSESLQRVEGGADESITNVQTRGVDEGDIVKRIGRFLVVLQDGRLFTVDTAPNREAGLALVDRINVYRNRLANPWYDEMLVAGNRILVTGYSYYLGATELSVFSLSEEGRLTRESVYYMSSNDYYDIENYATRLVDGNLVIYTPLDLTNVSPNERVDWPIVRRWVRGEGEDAVMAKSERLFNATDIYRPLQRTLHPVVHSISICPLGSPAAGDELTCTATAFIGPPDREFYISPEAAYLWVAEERVYRGDACAPAARDFNAATRAMLYRAPFGEGADGALAVRGRPRDQLGFASTDDEFRALLVWNAGSCPGGANTVNLKYFSTPLSAFAEAPLAADASRYIDTPSVPGGMYEQRFTEDYVIYGSRDSWSSYPPDSGRPAQARIVAVPTANPAAATIFEAPHNVIRVERVGTNALLTGYRDDTGLRLSLVDLSATPRIAATTLLRGRYESEGRSHAFNARVDENNEGLMGIPTVRMERQAGRYWDHSSASDLSFLSVADGGLADIGELLINENGAHASYQCEVSCVDWYGNSRPIFTGGRIFALLGTEIVEGAVQNGKMGELRRADLSAPPPPR